MIGKKELIIPAKELNESRNRSEEIHSALQDFNLPILSEDRLETEKSHFFKILRDCIVDISVIQQIANSKVLVAEIPKEFSKLYMEGKVKLDQSAKVLGNYTPNLRNGNGELIGQLTIKEGFNPAELTNAMANMALYNAVKEIAHKIEEVNERVLALLLGQKEDRYALITAAYETYELLLNDEQKSNIIPTCLLQVKTGLHQIHFDVVRKRNEMLDFPKSKMEVLKNAIVKQGSSVNKAKNALAQLTSDCNLYYKFILLSDMLMNDMGQLPQQILNNHSDFVKLCDSINNDEDLIRVLSFTKEDEFSEIQLLSEADLSYQTLLKEEVEAIKINLSSNDVKLLNQ